MRVASSPTSDGVWYTCHPCVLSPYYSPPLTGTGAGIGPLSPTLIVYVPTSAANEPPQAGQDLLCVQDKSGNWLSLPIRNNNSHVRYTLNDACGRPSTYLGADGSFHGLSFTGWSMTWVKGSETHTFDASHPSGSNLLTFTSIGTWTVTITCPNYTSQTFSETLGWGSNPELDIYLRTTDATAIRGHVNASCAGSDNSGVLATVYSGGTVLGFAYTDTAGNWTYTIPEPPLVSSGGTLPTYTYAISYGSLWVRDPAHSAPLSTSVVCGTAAQVGTTNMIANGPYHCTGLCRDPAPETLYAVDPGGATITLTWDSGTQAWWGCKFYPPATYANPRGYAIKTVWEFAGTGMTIYTNVNLGGGNVENYYPPGTCPSSTDLPGYTGTGWNAAAMEYWSFVLTSTGCSPLMATHTVTYNAAVYADPWLAPCFGNGGTYVFGLHE